MQKIIDIGYLLAIYFVLFILGKEIIETHLEWIPNRLFIPHDSYNHTLAPKFVQTVLVSPTNPKQKWDIRINNQELRADNDVTIPKPENVYRILMVGDSFIFGGNVKTIPEVVEDALNDKFGKPNLHFEVVNCGIPSYSPILHLARLKIQYLSFDANAIIYLPDLTDIYDDTHRYKWLARYDDSGNLIRVKGTTRILRSKRRHKRLINSFLAKYSLKKQELRDITKFQYGMHPHIYDHAMEPESQLSQFTRDEVAFSIGFIEKFLELSKTNNIHIAMAMYPHLPQIITAAQFYEYPLAIKRRYNRIFEKNVKELATRKKIMFRSFHNEIQQKVLSLTSLNIHWDRGLFERKVHKTYPANATPFETLYELVREKAISSVHENRMYYGNDMHFNDQGFRILAKEVADWVIRNPEKSIGFTLGDQTIANN